MCQPPMVGLLYLRLTCLRSTRMLLMALVLTTCYCWPLGLSPLPRTSLAVPAECTEGEQAMPGCVGNNTVATFEA